VRFDSAFEQVMRACAAPRRDGPGTWISEDIIAGYTGLHRMGYAHSAELWLDGELVGGAYGVCIGRMFYGESMFARVTDARRSPYPIWCASCVTRRKHDRLPTGDRPPGLAGRRAHPARAIPGASAQQY
jgi:leucyl/phenylalanyl-tRNA--protein transferase